MYDVNFKESSEALFDKIKHFCMRSEKLRRATGGDDLDVKGKR